MTYWYAPYWEKSFAAESVDDLVKQICKGLDKQLETEIDLVEHYHKPIRPSRISPKVTVKEKYGKITISKNSYTYFETSCGYKHTEKHMASVTVFPLSEIKA